MVKQITTALVLTFLFCGIHSASAQTSNKSSDPRTVDANELLFQAQQALTDVIIHDIFSPPVASRIYVYAHLSAYTTLSRFGNSACPSLSDKIKTFPGFKTIPVKMQSGIDPAAAAYFAFWQTARQLVFSESMLDSTFQYLYQRYVSAIPEEKEKRSRQLGKEVSDSILNWSNADHYKETRKLRRYQIKKMAGAWLPTPPAYMAAIEPYWKNIRLLTLDSASQFRPAPATAFSTDTSSLFYQEAAEVYTIGTNLSIEQREIASFWDCNPFHVTMNGHLSFATKKISPGGHWLQIAGLYSKNKGESIGALARAYTYTAIAIFDAFISCWEEKYNSQLIRPETYINSHINEEWRPLLQTPPFPEYPSGHSVVSGAAAEVLSYLYGDNVEFVDNTELPFGLPERKFHSFREASREAAISRLYGGIHYRPAIENGLTQGTKLGKWVVGALKQKN